MSAPTPPGQPLANIRVLDLTNVLAGPYGGYQLALLGAQVIKVERPGKGDLARQLGADADLNKANMGVSYLAQNAGKRSITLDLKQDAGKDILRQLAARSDVLLENFRPGVMDRLGLGYDALKGVNPTLIYCAVTGFGQDGPWRDNPAYDQIVQGVSGIMSITGTTETGPLRAGYPIADTLGGMTAAFAITAALQANPRGTFIDVSMTDAVISTMGWVVSNHTIGGVPPGRHGNENVTSAPSGTFQTATSPLNIAANKDEQWQALARHLGLDHLLTDPRFTTRDNRKQNRAALKTLLDTALSAKPAAVWVAELNPLGIPAGEVLDLADTLKTPQIADRGLMATHPAQPGIDREFQVAGSPVRLDNARPPTPPPPQPLGQDTDAILSDLGLDAAARDALRAKGVI